jgi:hypothetical protein
MTKRKDANAMVRWNQEARIWATDAGRRLALDLYYGRETGSRPYQVGVVLDAGEKIWAEVPVRFNLDLPTTATSHEALQPAIRSWLVTSGRVVGRLGDERLHGYRWEKSVGVRINLTPGSEDISVNIDGEPTLIWSGPGVTPLAVAAVYQLYGPVGLIEHPGLAILRTAIDFHQEHRAEFKKG